MKKYTVRINSPLYYAQIVGMALGIIGAMVLTVKIVEVFA